MSQCDRCGDSPVKAFNLGGFHTELCINCLNEWEEMRYSEPYRKESLDFDILHDCIEADLRARKPISYEVIERANKDSNHLRKMVFDMAKQFVLGNEPKKD